MIGPVPLRIFLQRDWANDIPLKFLWTISFFPRGVAAAAEQTTKSIADIGDNITSILERYEGPDKWPVDTGVYQRQSDDAELFGYMFASSVAFPNDAFNVNNSQLVGAGGFLPGYIGGERSGYGGSNNLNISFIETNIDIIDNFIRPWIIAASHKGLIEDNKEDIKCEIMVNFYTRDRDQHLRGPMGPFTTLNFERRKSFIFENAVPIQVGGDQISYGDLSVGEVTKTVTFAFTNYYTIPVL